MKIAVECESPLLQKSLELFLQNHLTAQSRCDIVLRDTKCLNDEKCFYIASSEDADLLKPFSKSQLILALEKKYKTLHDSAEIEETIVEDNEPTSRDSSLDFSILENRIEQLTQEYQSNIIRAVKAFYEK